MKKHVLFARHAESYKNVDNLFGDKRINQKLTEKGLSDSVMLANRIASLICFEHQAFNIISSPDLRSLMTTRIIANKNNCRYRTVKSLLPINAGYLSGISEEDAIVMYPELMLKKDKFKKGLISGYEISYPGGESVISFQNRVIFDFKKILDLPESLLIIVTHQSVITAILSYLKSMNSNADYYYYKIDLCSISSAYVDNAFATISYVNN